MLTMEKTNAEMSTMRDNQFFGDIAQEENNKKECAMMGLIKNQIIVLNEELDVAYNKKYWFYWILDNPAFCHVYRYFV